MNVIDNILNLQLFTKYNCLFVICYPNLFSFVLYNPRACTWLDNHVPMEQINAFFDFSCNFTLGLGMFSLKRTFLRLCWCQRF